MTCTRKRCKRRASSAGLCGTHATEEADRLFSLMIRSEGRCVAGDDGVRCSGNLQCCHGFSRRYRNTRYDPRNAWSMCQAHHVYYTHRPIEWGMFMRERLGENLYLILQATALKTTRVDMEVVLAELRAVDLEERIA